MEPRVVQMIIHGYFKINFDIIPPNIVCHVISLFYNLCNILPCKVYNNHGFNIGSKNDGTNFINIIPNGYTVFYRNFKNELYVNNDYEFGIFNPNLKTPTLSRYKYFNKISTNVNVISRGCTNYHAFLYTRNNKLYCVGKVLGSVNDLHAEIPLKMSPQLVKYKFSSNIIQIECGFSDSLFLDDKGNVYQCHCVVKYMPDNIIKINALKNIKQICCNQRTNYAVDINGILYSFGKYDNKYGEFGIGKRFDCSNKINIIKGYDVNKISGGNNHVLFINKNGDSYSFGLNNHGQCASFLEIIWKPKIVKYLRNNNIKISSIIFRSNIKSMIIIYFAG